MPKVISGLRLILDLRCLTARFLLVIIAFFALHAPANAFTIGRLWTSDGVSVCGYYKDQYAPAVAADGLGGAIIAWEDMRNYWPGRYDGYSYTNYTDIFAQRLDQDGKRKWMRTITFPSFSTNMEGIPAYEDYQVFSSNIKMINSGYGSVFAAFSVGQGSYPYVYRSIQYVKLGYFDGTKMAEGGWGGWNSYINWNWGFAPDGNLGALFCWSEWNQGVKAAWVTSSGGAGSWGSNPVNVCSYVGANETKNPQITMVSPGAAMVVWEDWTTSTPVFKTDIFVQKINPSGLTDWPSPVKICTYSDHDTYWKFPKIISDGMGGAIIVWMDYRYDTSGSGPFTEIRAQRIDAYGNVQWLDNGILLTPYYPLDAWPAYYYTDFMQRYPEIIPSYPGTYIVAWEDLREHGQGPGHYGVWGQRIDNDANLLWGNTGALILSLEADPVYGYQNYLVDVRIVPDQDGGAIISAVEQPGRYNIWAQRVDSDGSYKWSVNGIYVNPNATMEIDYNYAAPAIASTGNIGEAIITWTDRRFFNVNYTGTSIKRYDDVYAQKVGGTDLYPPLVTVEAPSTYPTIEAGIPFEIRWSATDDGELPKKDYIKIYIKRDGLPWQTIATSLENNISATSGIFTYEAFDEYDENYISIECTDGYGKHGFGISKKFKVSGLLSTVYVSSTRGLDTFAYGYGTFAKPYATVKMGLRRVAAGGLVSVESGTYLEHNLFWPARSNVRLGGVNPLTTIISGESLGRILTANSVSVSIEGVTMQDGRAGLAPYTNTCGGAIYHELASMTVKNCRFINNDAGTDGTFGGSGGAIYSVSSDDTYINCIFAGNRAGNGISVGGSAGALRAHYARIYNCTFYGNSAGRGGDFSGSGSGGAVWLYAGGTHKLKNSIFWNNTVPLGGIGSQVYVEGSTVLVDYCDVQNGSSGFGTGVGGLVQYNPSNINDDPLFASTDLEDADFLKLKLPSYCIDGGTSSEAPPDDIIGTARPQPAMGIGGIPDMGAYEFTGTAKVHNVTKDQHYFTIYAGLRNAGGNNLITVDPGTFKEHKLPWKANNVILRGSGIDSTIIDMEKANRAISLEVVANITIEGFTMSNGQAPSNANGGCIFMPSNSRLWLNYVRIENCSTDATRSGGAIRSVGCYVYARNCYFASNEAGYGGAIIGGTWEAVNCTFESNRAIAADGDGGAMRGSDAAMTNLMDWKGTSCDFINNAAVRNGGVACYTTLSASQCVFVNNQAGNAGGVVAYGYLSAYKCTFEANSSINDGGVLYAGFLKPTRVESSIFKNNSAGTNGGVVFDCNWIVTNCAFSANNANLGGVAYLAHYWSVMNCTFYNNTASTDAGVFHTSDNLKLINSIFWGGSDPFKNSQANRIYHNDAPDTAWAGITGTPINCITWEPMLVDPDNADFHPVEDSPVCEAGTTEGAPARDLDGVKRPQGIGIDIGCLEFPQLQVFLLQPSGPKITIEAGDHYLIKWEVISPYGDPTNTPYACLYVSTNEGSTWEVISTDFVPASTKTYDWSIIPIITTEARIKITVSKTPGTIMAKDSSLYDFSIRDPKPPLITLTTVLPQNVMQPMRYIGRAGETVDWSVTDIIPVANPVTVEVTTNEGASWTVAANNKLATDSILIRPPLNMNVPYHKVHVKVIARDFAGNKSSKEAFAGIDTKMPTMEIIISTESYSKIVPIVIRAYDEYGISRIMLKAGESASWEGYTKSQPWPTYITVRPSTSGPHDIRFEAYDLADNMTAEVRTVNLILPDAPQIIKVFVDGHNVQSLSYVSKNPLIKAEIFDYQSNLAEVRFTVRAGSYSSTEAAAPDQSPDDVTSYMASAETRTPGGNATLRIRVEAIDLDGNITTYESSALLLTASASVTQKPKTMPNPFSPYREKTYFIYKLSTDSNIRLAIYDIRGKLVCQKNFSAGQEGGKGPYDENKVAWDGRNDSGTILPNGVYLYIITDDNNNILDKGQLSIID